MLTKIFAPIINGSPKLKRAVWKGWYQFLARGYAQEEWAFMNYGFASDDVVGLDAADEKDRYSIQLYHRVVGGIDLTGKDVLEVGSGRGGGSSYIARYFKPKSMLGVDYSDNAVNLSSKSHDVSNLKFQQGDAEALPFPDSAFDAVVNVESSHCYGSMERFLSEVYRVLKPGGYFLWVDMRGPDQTEIVRKQFVGAGLTIENEANITQNVVLALDKVQENKRAMIGRHVPKFLLSYFEDFAGIPGTRVYESLKAGKVEYWCWKMRKPPVL